LLLTIDKQSIQPVKIHFFLQRVQRNSYVDFFVPKCLIHMNQFICDWTKIGSKRIGDVLLLLL
jgi:hypothetical protein